MGEAYSPIRFRNAHILFLAKIAWIILFKDRGGFADTLSPE
jgi:hypothetical protein